MSKSASSKRNRRNREKGQEGEREIVHMAQAAGLYAERSWRAAQSRYENVRSIDVLIEGEPFQVKLSKGFSLLYKALLGVSGLFVRQPHKEWVVVIPARQYFALLKRTTTEHKATTLQRIQQDSLDLHGPKRPYRRGK